MASRNTTFAMERDPLRLLERYKLKADSAPSSAIILATNAKVEKNEKVGYLTGAIHLSPSTESVAHGGVNMCARASEGCRQACLRSSGCHVMPYQKVRRIALTLWWLQDREGFCARLDREIASFAKRAQRKGLLPAVRPNALSDRRDLALRLVDQHPAVLFYDYTKLPRPWKVNRPGRYHLTFSRSEANNAACFDALEHGINVAVVFDGPLPATYWGREVVNGDESDARFLEEGRGVVIGLSLKGTNKAKKWARESGFAIQTKERMQ